METLREFAASSHLILSFARRDIRARYRQTALGVAWAIIQPFSMMLVFSLVFDRFAKLPSDGVPYPLFAYSGLIFWTFFTQTVTQGTMAMAANASLVRKIYFPRETLLLSVLLSAALDLAIAFSILMVMFVYFKVALTWTVLWLLPLVGLQALLTLAVICITSVVHVYFRDIGHAMPLVLQLGLFATPVLYPLSVIPERLLPYYLLNPLALIFDGYRRILLHGLPPEPAHLAIGFVVAVALVPLAYVGFKRAERSFADVL